MNLTYDDLIRIWETPYNDASDGSGQYLVGYHKGAQAARGQCLQELREAMRQAAALAQQAQPLTDEHGRRDPHVWEENGGKRSCAGAQQAQPRWFEESAIYDAITVELPELSEANRRLAAKAAMRSVRTDVCELCKDAGACTADCAQQAQPETCICGGYPHGKCCDHDCPNHTGNTGLGQCPLCPQQAQPLTDEMIEERANHLSGEGEFANGTERTRYKHGAKWARDFRAPMPTLEQIAQAIYENGPHAEGYDGRGNYGFGVPGDMNTEPAYAAAAVVVALYAAQEPQPTCDFCKSTPCLKMAACYNAAERRR